MAGIKRSGLFKSFCCPSGSLLCSGLTFLILGILLPGAIVELVDYMIGQEIFIDSYDHENYDPWLTNADSDDPAEHLVAYIWNITNLNEFIAGELPILEEVGPYAFRYYVYKYNVSFGDYATRGMDSGDVAYFRRHREFYYDPTFKGTRDPYADYVCQINIVYAAAVVGGNVTEDPVRGPGGPGDVGARYFFGEEPTSMVTATEFLFGGPYPYYMNVSLDQFFRDSSPFNEGFRAQRTGKDNRDGAGQFILWDEKKDLRDVWADDHIEYIYGSDGTIFHHDVKHSDIIYAWEPDIGRIVPMVNEKKREIEKEGITAYRFVTPLDFYWNCETNDANCKYYMDGPSGFFNLSYRALGIPMFTGKAHLYGVEDSIRDEVIGVSPPYPDIHGSTVDLEPYTGITVGGAKVGEVVVLVGPTNGYYQEMRYTHLPIFWTSEGGNITKSLADEMAIGIYTALGFAEAFWYIGLILGPLLLVGSAYTFTKWHKNNFVLAGDLTHYERERLINSADVTF